MSAFGNRGLVARAGIALVVANIRFWPTVAPLVSAQLKRWERRARVIDDPVLKKLALQKLRDERFNAEVAATLATAERHVASQLTGGLTQAQSEALEALLAPKPDTAMSVLAWARLPAGAPGHTALKRLTEQLACLRAIGLDPACADGVHAERLRKLLPHARFPLPSAAWCWAS